MLASLESPNLSAAVETERFQLRVPSRLEWIQPAVEYLCQRAILCSACDETRSARLMLALHEALTNSVVHGNLELSSDLKEQDDNSFAAELAARAANPLYASRNVTIDVVYDGERCQWTLLDEGKGFDVERVLARDAARAGDVSMVSGRGILMMRTFLDTVQYDQGGRRVVLTLLRSSGEEKRRRSRQPAERGTRGAARHADGPIDAAVETLLAGYRGKNPISEERRAYERSVYTERIDISGDGGDDKPRVGFARDLSKGGIAFITTMPLPLERCTLALPQGDGSALRVRCQIVRCLRIMEGYFDVGAQFVELENGKQC
jgi:anti-sigma regulatory factor (Ser/Thr protein kinase)